MNQSGKKHSISIKEPGTSQISSAPEKSVAKRVDVNESEKSATRITLHRNPERDSFTAGCVYAVHVDGVETRCQFNSEIVNDLMFTHYLPYDEIMDEVVNIILHEATYEATGGLEDHSLFNDEERLSLRIQITGIIEDFKKSNQ